MYTIECERLGRLVQLRHERDAVKFELREYVRQQRRPLNDEEIRDGWGAHSKYRVEQTATGFFRGKVDEYLPKGIPTVWTETEDAPFEAKLGEVAATVLAALAHAKVRREQREEAERRRWEEQQAAWRREEIAKAERARRQALRQKASDWREAQAIRAFVAAVRDAANAGRLSMEATELSEWSAWASQCAKDLDPIEAGSVVGMTEKT